MYCMDHNLLIILVVFCILCLCSISGIGAYFFLYEDSATTTEIHNRSKSSIPSATPSTTQPTSQPASSSSIPSYTHSSVPAPAPTQAPAPAPKNVIDSGYSDWAMISGCSSGMCDGVTKYERVCMNPSQDCSGESTKTETCSPTCSPILLYDTNWVADKGWAELGPTVINIKKPVNSTMNDQYGTSYRVNLELVIKVNPNDPAFVFSVFCEWPNNIKSDGYASKYTSLGRVGIVGTNPLVLDRNNTVEFTYLPDKNYINIWSSVGFLIRNRGYDFSKSILSGETNLIKFKRSG